MYFRRVAMLKGTKVRGPRESQKCGLWSASPRPAGTRQAARSATLSQVGFPIVFASIMEKLFCILTEGRSLGRDQHSNYVLEQTVGRGRRVF